MDFTTYCTIHFSQKKENHFFKSPTLPLFPSAHVPLARPGPTQEDARSAFGASEQSSKETTGDRRLTGEHIAGDGLSSESAYTKHFPSHAHLPVVPLNTRSTTVSTAPVMAARRRTTTSKMTGGELSNHGNFTYAYNILPRTLLCYRFNG
jgi:hypothetical protein